MVMPRSAPQTVAEIAASTGVSKTTVRLVLNGQAERYRISEATRKRIDDYVRAHGVVIDHAARSLKLRRSETIGLVVPDLANAFFAGVMAELERLCRASHLMLLTASSHEDPELESQAVRRLLARGVDGLVVAPCQRPVASLYARYRDRVGVVMVDRAFAGSPFPAVVSDNYVAARHLGARLLAEAAGDVVFLCAKPELPSVGERIRGFADALAAAGVARAAERVCRDDEDSPAAGARMVERAIARLGATPRAVVASSLLVLQGALQHLKVRLGRVPTDLLVGTFDWEAMLEFLPNRVVAVVQDEAGIAARAFAALDIGAAATFAGPQVVPCRFSA